MLHDLVSGKVTVNDGLCVVNSKLLAHLFAVHDDVVKFYHFIRLWLSCGNVEFKEYQLTLLVLFFLQTRNFVPSMKRVQKNLPRKMIKGENIQVTKKIKTKQGVCLQDGRFSSTKSTGALNIC